MIYLTSGPIAVAAKSQWLPTIRKAVDDADGRWSEEQLLSDVEDGRLLVWIVTRDENVVGVFTTRVMQSRITWVLIEDLAGDDFASWVTEGLHALEAWARELGAEQILMEGRRGWEKVLRPYGFAATRIQAVKHLRTIQ